MVSKQFLVVAYDIASDRRRRKLVKILEGYGVRVNFSVFECLLMPARIENMKRELSRYIKPGKDNVLIYNLCRDCVNNRTSLGGFDTDAELVNLL